MLWSIETKADTQNVENFKIPHYLFTNEETNALIKHTNEWQHNKHRQLYCSVICSKGIYINVIESREMGIKGTPK